MRLDSRKEAILKAIVHRYITTGVPVGSRIITQILNLEVSSATIRNEMSKLEDMGYLYQPHVSAGRIPTDMGYRYFVDMLMGKPVVDDEDRGAINALFSAKSRELENTLQETTFLLSKLTRSTALIIAPRLESSSIKHVDLLLLRENRFLLVLIMDTGMVEKKVLNIRVKLNDDELEDAQRVLNNLLNRKGIDEIRKIERVDIEKVSLCSEGSLKLIKRVLSEIGNMLSVGENEKIYLGGRANLIKYFEPDLTIRIEELMEMIEEQYKLLNLVSEVMAANDILIRIGDENTINEMRNCSFVGTSYGFEGENLGTVGVLGPTRMNYERVIPAVSYIAKVLSQTVENIREPR